MPLLPLEVKVYQGIDEELVDNEPDRGTDERCAKGLSHLTSSGVLRWIVDLSKGSAAGVSGKESIVWYGTAAVTATNDGTGGRIDEPLQERVARSHDVVSGVLMKHWSEQRVAEDTI